MPFPGIGSAPLAPPTAALHPPLSWRPQPAPRHATPTALPRRRMPGASPPLQAAPIKLEGGEGHVPLEPQIPVLNSPPVPEHGGRPPVPDDVDRLPNSFLSLSFLTTLNKKTALLPARHPPHRATYWRLLYQRSNTQSEPSTVRPSRAPWDRARVRPHLTLSFAGRRYPTPLLSAGHGVCAASNHDATDDSRSARCSRLQQVPARTPGWLAATWQAGPATCHATPGQAPPAPAAAAGSSDPRGILLGPTAPGTRSRQPPAAGGADICAATAGHRNAGVPGHPPGSAIPCHPRVGPGGGGMPGPALCDRGGWGGGASMLGRRTHGRAGQLRLCTPHPPVLTTSLRFPCCRKTMQSLCERALCRPASRRSTASRRDTPRRSRPCRTTSGGGAPTRPRGSSCPGDSRPCLA